MDELDEFLGGLRIHNKYQMGCFVDTTAIEKLKQLLKKGQLETAIKELESLHRAGGNLDYDNETDEMIDDRVEELEKELDELS